MPQYQWQILGMTRDTTTDVVSEIQWQCVATQDKYQEAYLGSIGLKPIDPQDPNFIPWASITKEQAISWLKAILDDPESLSHHGSTADIQEVLNRRIQDRIHPRILTSLPW